MIATNTASIRITTKLESDVLPIVQPELLSEEAPEVNEEEAPTPNTERWFTVNVIVPATGSISLISLSGTRLRLSSVSISLKLEL